MVGDHFLNMHGRWKRVGRPLRVHHLQKSVAREPESAVTGFGRRGLADVCKTRVSAIECINLYKRYFTRGKSLPSLPLVRRDPQDSTGRTKPASALIILNQGVDFGAGNLVPDFNTSQLTA